MSASSPFAGKTRYFVLAAVCILVDLLSKWWVFERVEFPQGAFDNHAELPIVPGFFALVKLSNPGAVGGIGGDHPWPLVGLRLLAVLVVAVVILRVRRERWFLLTALALVLGGALGNLYDNIFLRAGGKPGEVRDFLSFDLSAIGIEEIPMLVHGGHFNAFNLADACIVCGAIALILTSFFHAEPGGDEGSGSTPEAREA